MHPSISIFLHMNRVMPFCGKIVSFCQNLSELLQRHDTPFNNFLKTISEKVKKDIRLPIIIIDLVCLLLVLTYGQGVATHIVSPLLSPLSTFPYFASEKTTKEKFSFVPGSAPNKFDSVRVKGVNTLAFFDVPVTPDGEINRESIGYNVLMGEDAALLIERAHAYGTKVTVTLSQTSQRSIIAILDDEMAQQTIINGAIETVRNAGIDGVTLDFELTGSVDLEYKHKFTQFVARLTQELHKEVSGSTLSVVVPPTALQTPGMYDVENLTNSADRIFLAALNFVVPERKDTKAENPVYGYRSEEYWKSVTGLVQQFLHHTTSEKLVMETAWYGDGDNYPLYRPSAKSDTQNNVVAEHVTINERTIERLVAGIDGIEARAAARKNIPLIAQALKDEGILNSNVLAYALATIEHETAGTFEPISEYYGNLSARRLGYEGGTYYYGRGFIQLTHLRNYRIVGERIGMGEALAKNPELASDPKTAAKVLAAFFKDNNIANLASQGEFVAARMPVNPDRNGWHIATLAYKFESE